MIIKSKPQLNTYLQATKISTQILKQLKDATQAGVKPIEIDDLAQDLCRQHQVKPAFLGVPGTKGPYQHATCISINDTIVHGVPSGNYKIRVGDIVKLDFGIIYQGLYTDHCITVGVGKLDPKDQLLVETTREAVQIAAKAAIVGNTTGYLGHLMHSTVQEKGFDVLKNYIGHGIGHSLHESPQVPAFGQPMSGQILKKGMVICVEAQVVAGSDRSYTASDGWSVKTRDGQNSAMFEYMVMVGKRKPKILTKTMDWDILV